MPISLGANIQQGGCVMSSVLKLPLDERVQLVEDIWDSIAAEQSSLPLTESQKQELEKRLQAYESDGLIGSPASEVLEKIRQKL